jgi:hypothetical protein
MKPFDRWSRALAAHRSASAAFATAAEEVEPDAWHRPRAEGKWSPAQMTDHLIQTYDILLRELDGDQGMRVRTRFLRRVFLRLTLMPRLLGEAASRSGCQPLLRYVPATHRPINRTGSPSSGGEPLSSRPLLSGLAGRIPAHS